MLTAFFSSFTVPLSKSNATFYSRDAGTFDNPPVQKDLVLHFLSASNPPRRAFRPGVVSVDKLLAQATFDLKATLATKFARMCQKRRERRE